MQFNQQFINNLIIGTQSKTRKKLFKEAGLIFNYKSPNIDEQSILLNHKILQSKQALHLAKEKALHLSKKNKDSTVICFDTTIHVNNKTVFKASTRKECLDILRQLNAKKHVLYTACIIMKNKKTLWTIVEKANITFKNNSEKKMRNYVTSYFNKIVNSVGCYNIESHGKEVINKIEGSYFAILGVPLIPLYRELKKTK